MKIELEIEETRELFGCLTGLMLAAAGLDEADQATLRQWRTQMTPGSDGMRELSAKMNADLARTLENKKRSQVRKPDWR